jgi:hypothetical protein
VESKGGDVDGAVERAGDLDGTAELRPARALAVIAIAGGAALLGVLPALIALGAARPQLELVVPWLAGLAAVAGGMKLAVAAGGIAGRLWSEHTARLATALGD